jgi:tight adherence protein B
MGAAILALFVIGGLLGILAIVLGLHPVEEDQSAKMPSRMQTRLTTYRSQFSKRRQLIAVAGLAGGILLWIVSGWIVALIAVPAAAIGVPILLGKGAEPQNIERLEAIETWTRSLSGLIVSGAGLEQAIMVSLSSTPTALRDPVTRLVARINARWSIADSLQSFADDLADPTGDLVVAHLQLAASERGPGLANALDDLAQDVFDEVKARRQIEADRAKPRQNVRLITYITLGVLALLPLGGQFFTPYGTPVGQLLLAVWLVIYVAVLVWLKQFSTGRPTPRILTNPQQEARR